MLRPAIRDKRLRGQRRLRFTAAIGFDGEP
jgi:hypothetical protein